jgi:hypothetical protein
VKGEQFLELPGLVCCGGITPRGGANGFDTGTFRRTMANASTKTPVYSIKYREGTEAAIIKSTRRSRNNELQGLFREAFFAGSPRSTARLMSELANMKPC